MLIEHVDTFQMYKINDCNWITTEYNNSTKYITHMDTNKIWVKQDTVQTNTESVQCILYKLNEWAVWASGEN